MPSLVGRARARGEKQNAPDFSGAYSLGLLGVPVGATLTTSNLEKDWVLDCGRCFIDAVCEELALFGGGRVRHCLTFRWWLIGQ
jgi:hypothetical protein